MASPAVTCQGCIENQPNQLAHMEEGGCLYVPEEPYDVEEEIAQEVAPEIDAPITLTFKSAEEGFDDIRVVMKPSSFDRWFAELYRIRYRFITNDGEIPIKQIGGQLQIKKNNQYVPFTLDELNTYGEVQIADTLNDIHSADSEAFEIILNAFVRLIEQ